MIYALDDLLVKMGAPEVKEKGRVEWHYFDPADKKLAGHANIRLEAGGEFLVAELKRMHDNFEDDDGNVHAHYEEKFFLYAERAARAGHYRITRVAFDGQDYGNPQKSVIELGLSVFHARALDISIRMVEQTFNKQDILELRDEAPMPTRKPSFKSFFMQQTKPQPKQSAVIIPFRPRIAGTGAVSNQL